MIPIFCFVILHYKTAEDTIDCLNSIKCLNEECKIVIVDNASNNGSIERIEEYTYNNKNIYILKNESNLGFAEGNNIGYNFARNNLKADFIAICNNDTVIDSKDFIQCCKEIYKRTNYYILGPDIESTIDGGHQNPMIIDIPNINKIKREIIRYRMLLFLNSIGLYDMLKPKTASETLCNKSYNEEREDVPLHGSFMIFSPAFLKTEEYAFRPGTFLYMEESILYYYCKKNFYKTVYSPNIKVLHKEDSSTNSLFNHNKDKRSFVFNNMIQSMKVYIKYIKEYDN